MTTEGETFQPCPNSRAGPLPVPSVAMPAFPFSPLKFSGLMDRDFASDSRERLAEWTQGDLTGRRVLVGSTAGNPSNLNPAERENMRIIAGLISLSIAVYLATFLTPSGVQGQWNIEFMRISTGHSYSISAQWLWYPVLYGVYNILLGEYDDYHGRNAKNNKAGESSDPE
jgi:hypothetical protein